MVPSHSFFPEDHSWSQKKKSKKKHKHRLDSSYQDIDSSVTDSFTKIKPAANDTDNVDSSSAKKKKKKHKHKD